METKYLQAYEKCLEELEKRRIYLRAKAKAEQTLRRNHPEEYKLLLHNFQVELQDTIPLLPGHPDPDIRAFIGKTYLAKKEKERQRRKEKRDGG